MSIRQYPRVINYFVISVLDLDKALTWCQEVLGFTIIRGPTELIADDPTVGNALQDIFGLQFKKLRIVWLSSSNILVFEIFQLILIQRLSRGPRFFEKLCQLFPMKSVSFV